jgi:UDP-N-acetylglucosamine 2-epimerase (hydrolysing)
MKKIAFLTGTRADFGKIKSLIQILENHNNQFEVHLFVTGMHMQTAYGYTYIEVEKCGFKNISTYENYTHETTMDLTLAKTIEGFSVFIKNVKPDLVVVHGDRVEALAGAIVGSLNNILVAHIEGGEISGTIDELIRHSVSKLSHIHFVSNKEAENRLLQMGELSNTIFEIGSPDLDIMFSPNLPNIDTVKVYYEIPFSRYGIVMFHPVTTEIANTKKQIQNLINALLNSEKNYVVIYPNNDLGSSVIIEEYLRLNNNSRFRILPSLRFEYYLTLLKNADFIIGNSSAGIREAPYFNIPSINIGTRQNNRVKNDVIFNIGYEEKEILESVRNYHLGKSSFLNEVDFGKGNSAQLFYEILNSENIWKISNQKQFKDQIVK